MTDHDLARLADLHRRCLPGSILTGLGAPLLSRYYGWVSSAAAAREALFVERVGDEVAGAAVLTLELRTLMARFAASHPLRLGRAVGGGLLRGGVRRGLAAFVHDSLRGEDDPLAGLPEVVQIFADSAHRGAGLGTRLLAQVEERLRADGHAVYSVRTQRDDNQATLAFYERRGFVVRGEVTQAGEAYLRLERRLESGGARPDR